MQIAAENGQRKIPSPAKTRPFGRGSRGKFRWSRRASPEGSGLETRLAPRRKRFAGRRSSIDSPKFEIELSLYIPLSLRVFLRLVFSPSFFRDSIELNDTGGERDSRASRNVKKREANNSVVVSARSERRKSARRTDGKGAGKGERGERERERVRTAGWREKKRERRGRRGNGANAECTLT